MGSQGISCSLMVGAMLLLLSGGCSLFFLLHNAQVWRMALLFGGPFIVLGLIFVSFDIGRDGRKILGIWVLILLGVGLLFYIWSYPENFHYVLLYAAPFVLIGLVVTLRVGSSGEVRYGEKHDDPWRGKGM